MAEPPQEPSSLSATAATQVLIVTASPHHDPPPPYPSRERRRAGRSGRRRRTVGGDLEQLQTTSIGNESDGGPSTHSPNITSPDLEHHIENASETTPLLSPSRLPPGGISRRQRTLSVSSTLQSAVSAAPSFTHTVLFAFQPDRDCDLDPDEDNTRELEDHDLLDSPVPRPGPSDEQTRLFASELAAIQERRSLSFGTRLRRYFRPMVRRAYYSALFHLLIINFPYALVAWVYLFVFTLTGTTTLMALPLGALLCFLDLLGARIFSRGELYLQTTFHGPLAFPPPYPPHPIFTRTRMPTPAEIEDGIGPREEQSFYRNSYAMFTDPTSHQALFYFLVIKPGITVFLSLIVITLVPVSFVLVLPAPAMLRLIRRLGIWQANIAVDGLYYVGR
ncbi:hypothetical protein BDY19DRAFT_952061 [Irpex rosettiformis]|uniref:Uncharacterized protein n=1 Tax=Irpex rosettiformis TaxID=378272 RepID=A0ACB8U273_9APHY|nr:hypothetical protein BDY19DRAFT_952061 [Irpex rosettiformis]